MENIPNIAQPLGNKWDDALSEKLKCSLAPQELKSIICSLEDKRKEMCTCYADDFFFDADNLMAKSRLQRILELHEYIKFMQSHQQDLSQSKIEH